MRESVKKLNYYFMSQIRVIIKKNIFLYVEEEKERICYWEKEQGQLLISNTIIKTEMASEKYLIPIARVIHNIH